MTATAMQPQPDQASTSPLGVGVLARRGQNGVVPEGCFGLSRDGERVQRHLAGKPAKTPKGGRLWWVCEGPVELRFAPQPQSPEAGVQVTIELFMPNGALDNNWVRWMDEQPDTVDSGVLAFDLRERGPLKSIPPCVGQDELTRRARMLSADLVNECGLRCTSLTRIDLFPNVDTSQPVTAQSNAQQTSMATPAASEQARPIPNAIGNPNSWAALAAQDQRAGRRLFLELPLLATAVRSWAWVNTEPLFSIQRDLSERLNHLAGTLGRLPSLQPNAGPKRNPDVTTGRLIAAYSQRAVEALGSAWAVMETVPPHEAPNAQCLALLEDAVRRLENAVQRRKQPWWELQE